MKKILFSIILFISAGIYARLNAQACTISNVAVDLKSTAAGGGTCTMTIDLTFSLTNNNGNKYVWIHLWQASSYPGLSYNAPPTAAQLSGDLANIGISDNGSVVLMNSYAPAPSVPVEYTGLTVSSVISGLKIIYTIHNVTLAVPGSCSTTATIKGDAWSTQSQSQNNVQCFSSGSFLFTPNDPIITGFKRCTSPRTLSLGISTKSLTNINVSYTLYKDDGDGIFEPGTNDVAVGTGGPFTINSSTSYSNANLGYTGNNVSQENSAIWVAVTSDVPGSSTVVDLFTSACATLPVNLGYFNAKRNNANTVNLTWQTLQELNSSGFEIQRQIGNTGWQVIGFVHSQSVNGNSSMPLNYSYNDNNSADGVTQYRLRMVDIDGNSKFSETRSVRGEGQTGKIIVFPNPSSDGKVKIIFEAASGTHDVFLTDMSGRLIRQWSQVTNNNLEIDNISTGFYSVKIINRETNEQSVEKIIITKH